MDYVLSSNWHDQNACTIKMYMDMFCANYDPISVGEGNETFLVWLWKPLPSTRIFKRVKLKTICNKLKRTISASGQFRL